MTTNDSTTGAAEMLQKKGRILAKGADGLNVIRHIEAGTQSIHSVPAMMQADGDHILTLCENGELWVVPDGTAEEAFKAAEIIPAARVAQLYRFFWSAAFAEIVEIAQVLAADQKTQARKARRDAYVKSVLTYSIADDPYPNFTDLRIAPNCEGDILTHPPRLVRDAEGFQRLHLKGDDGWKDQGVVEEVTRLERYGLVLVATDDASYLMSATDFDIPLE